MKNPACRPASPNRGEQAGKNVWFISLIHKPDLKQLAKNLAILRNYHVVLIDNRDDKKSPIPTETKNLHILKPDTNLGFAGGNNLGATYAINHKAEWIVILNDDLVLDKAGIIEFAESLNHTPVSLAGPYPGRLEPKRWSTILTAKISEKFDYLSGSFLAIHTDVIKKLGQLFYEPYFIYYEDVELSIRAKKAGFPLIYRKVPGLKHLGSRTMQTSSKLTNYYLSRNHLLFMERNAPPGIRIREYFRLFRSYFELISSNDTSGTLLGIQDFFRSKFGRNDRINL